MIYNWKNGNIFNSTAKVIAHQVNCFGVMGSGIAKTIKETYPTVYKAYKDSCDRVDNPSELLGKCSVFYAKEDLMIANLFGQLKYGRDKRYTDYEALYTALGSLRQYADQALNELDSISFPDMIGCGLAGGDRDIVLELIRHHFKDEKFDIQIWKL